MFLDLHMANMSFTSHCVQYLSLFPGAPFWGKFALLISGIFSFSTFSFSRKYHEFRRKLWRFFLKEGDLLAKLLKREGLGNRESWIKLFSNERKQFSYKLMGFGDLYELHSWQNVKKKKRSQAGVAISRPPSRFLVICCCSRHLGCPFAL